MDTSKVLFKNKGRGYNKNDVNEYIIAENKRFTDAEAAFKRTLQEKERVIDGFSNELNKCNNENYLLKNSVAEKDKIIDSLNAKVGDFENTVAELREKITKLEEAASVEKQISSTTRKPIIEAKPDPVVVPQRTVITRESEVQTERKIEEDVDSLPYEKDEDLRVVYKKAEAYDCICDQIDEILSHAKIEADHIINTAIETSRKIRSSRNEIDLMKRDITGRSTGIIGEIKKSIVTKKR